MKGYIAIDIGGTQLRAASYDPNSLKPLKIKRVQSQSAEIPTQKRIIQVVQSVWPEDYHIEAIGIAVAGPLNLKTGVIHKSPNIPDFENFPIVEYLSNHFETPVLLGNDANLAALGEWKFGAGQGHENIIYLTISTGVGSGVIENGRMLLGARGMAAELGHVTIVPDGPICSCGKRGHLESISSGTAIAKWVKEEIKKGEESILVNSSLITAKEVAEAAQMNDALALAAFKHSGEILGIAIVNFLHIFNPTCIIFGGGVSKSIDLLIPHINNALENQVFAPNYCEDLVLITAELGDDAGLLGALALARENS